MISEITAKYYFADPAEFERMWDYFGALLLKKKCPEDPTKKYTKLHDTWHNLDILITKKCIRVSGNFSWQKLPESIAEIEAGLQVSFGDFAVTRLSLSHSFEMTHPANSYLPLLGELDLKIRKENKNQLCYYNTLSELTFTADGNILCYENKLLSKVSLQLKREEVLVKDLLNSEIYLSLLEKYLKDYLSIEKFRTLQLSASSTRNVKQFEKALIRLGIERIGGILAVRKVIRAMGYRKLFANRTQKSRILERINDIMDTEDQGIIEPDHLQELTAKIIQAVKHHKG